MNFDRVIKMRTTPLSNRELDIVLKTKSKWEDFFSTEKESKINRSDAIIGINNLYKLCSLNNPKVIFAENLMLGQKMANEIVRSGDSIHLTEINSRLWFNVIYPQDSKIQKSLSNTIILQVKKLIELDLPKNNFQPTVNEQVKKSLENQGLAFFDLINYKYPHLINLIAYYDSLSQLGIFLGNRIKSFINLVESGVFQVIYLHDTCIIIDSTTT